MQKKFLSILLTAAITLSLFAAVPFGTAAETAGSTANATLETQAEKDYYGNNTNFNGQIVELTDGHGSVLSLPVIGGPHTPQNRQFRIAQYDVANTFTAVKFKPGIQYTISFDYNINVDTDWGVIYFKLIYVHSGNNADSMFWANSTGAEDWTRIDAGQVPKNSNGWTQWTYSFTVSQETELMFAPVAGDGWKNNQQLYIDNITVNSNELKGTAVTDFESEAQRAYHSNTSTEKSTVTVGQPTGETNYAAKFGTILNPRCNNAWNSTLRITMDSNGTVVPVSVEAGVKYNISFKVKAETLSYKITDFYLCYVTSSSNGYVLGGNTAPQDYAKKTTFATSYTIDAMKADWITFSFDFTVPEDIGDKNQLALFPIAADEGESWQNQNQILWIDDVAITKYATVNAHNESFGDFSISTVYGEALDDTNLPLPSVKAVAWYKDEARTKPFTGAVNSNTLELWVDLQSVTGDFDNYVMAGDYWGKGRFTVQPFKGTNNSAALTNAVGFSSNQQPEWPHVIAIQNADGTNLKTIPNHTYKLEFDINYEDPSKLMDHSQVAIVKNGPSYGSNGSGMQFYGCYVNVTAEDGTTSQAWTNYFEKDKYTYNGATEGYYLHKSYTISSGSSSNYIILALWQVNTPVYIDNVRLVDLTAQTPVKDNNGNTIASGYIGETVSLPDATDADFVYYADGNGNPVTSTVVLADKTLTRVDSVIAVNSSEFDAANYTLSLKARFGGMGYETDDLGHVTVKTVTVGGKKYLVEDMGLLVAPAANGEPTLGDLKGGTKISGTSLKYSTIGENELNVTAKISVNGKYDRNYSVVGYIKCVGGKVIYGKMRNSIAKNYNAAAGFDAVANSAHTKTFGSKTYKLASNSEFNSGDADVFNKWDIWGQTSTYDNSSVTAYSTKSAISTSGGNLDLTVKQINSTSQEIPRVHSKYKFTTGYLEVRAKFSENELLGGCIWLNSAGIKSQECVYPVTTTDTHVFPEIDIAEFGNPHQSFTTLHSWGTNSNGNFNNRDQVRLTPLEGTTVAGDSTVLQIDLTQYHTFGLERTADYIKIYIDGTLYYQYTLTEALANKDNWPNASRTENEIKALFENPTYLILSTGTGGKALANGTEAVSNIDYVRFYK